MMKFLIRSAILLLCLQALMGCAATVVLSQADDANNPSCAKVMVRLPQDTDGLTKRSTNSQSTAAFGTPVAVTLRCGLKPILVSALPCLTAGGVDWIVDESNKPKYTFISFGRTPATEITVDSTKASGATVLEDLGQAVQFTPVSKKCLG
jgi:hypothetical protein